MADSVQQRATLRIFVVEDHPDTLKQMRLMLESFGYCVFTARTVREAVATFAASRAAVLISDIGLPDGDGWDLLRQLRRSPFAFHAFAMSGFGTFDEQSESREAGYSRIFVKPFEPGELERALAAIAAETDATRHAP